MMNLKKMAETAKASRYFVSEIIARSIEDKIKKEESGMIKYHYMKNGAQWTTRRCSCGNIDTYESAYSWSPRASSVVLRCSRCSCESNDYGTMYPSSQAFGVVEKNEEGFAISFYDTVSSAELPEKGDPEYKVTHLQANVREEDPELLFMIVYSTKFGPAIYNSQVSKLKNVPYMKLGASKWHDPSCLVLGDVEDVAKSHKIPLITGEMSVKKIWDMVSDLDYENAESDTEKKSNKEAKEAAEEAAIKSHSIGVSEISEYMAKAAKKYYEDSIKMYDTSSGGAIYVCECGHCGAVFTATKQETDGCKVVCKECGETIEEKWMLLNNYVSLSDWSVDTEKNLILSIYSANIEKVGTINDWVKKGRSEYRIVPGSIKTSKQIKFVNKPVAKPSKSIGEYGFNSVNGVITPISEVINDSSFRYCNVEKVKDEKRLNQITAYLENVARYPFIVGLVSRGLTKAASDICHYLLENRSEAAKYRGKTDVREALGLSKTVLKLATRYQLDWVQIQMLKNMMAVDSSLAYEDFDWLITNLSVNDVIDVIRTIRKINNHVIKPVHVADVKKYIESLYYEQGIDYTGGLQIWTDYLEYMNEMNFKPAAYKQKLFPQSLKKDHDILQLALNNIEMEDKAEAFKETIESGHRLEYSFEDLMVVMPQSVEDIVEEGVYLHHSVAQHIEKVADKKEYICFIREKAAPDTPYYTVEVLREGRGKIVQVRSFSNLPADDRIKAFLNKWASYKKLVIASL